MLMVLMQIDSTEETLVKSTTLAGEVSDKYRSRWVYFPLFIETCGTIRRKEPRNWAACWFQNDCCEAGTQMRYDNICYTGVMEVDGAAQVIWAQREYFPVLQLSVKWWMRTN